MAGIGNTIAPMYLSEIAPFSQRGAFGTLHQLLVTAGIFLSSVFGLKELLGIIIINYVCYITPLTAGNGAVV